MDGGEAVNALYSNVDLTVSFTLSKGEIKNFVTLDLEFLRLSGQEQPGPWGTAQPHNGFEELKPLMKLAMGHQTRLEGGSLTPDMTFHPSLKTSPVKLNNPKHMITLNNLRKAFGASWTPTYSFLNDFEKECKERWGKPTVSNRYLI